MIQIYGRRKCATTRKAQRFFSDRSIAVQYVDIDQKTPGTRELELFLQVAGDRVIDTQGKLFQSRGLAYMDYDPLEEISESPGLLRTPIVRNGRSIVVGPDEAGWGQVASQAARGDAQ